MNLHKSLYWLAAMAIIFSATACGDDDEVVPPNEEEVITTVNFTLTPTGGGDAVVFQFLDLDGDGGNAPTITGGTLKANTEYSGSFELLNESESPAEDITAEIQEEDEEHQFFFTVDAALNLTINYDDTDSDGRPLGLATKVAAGDASNGNMTVVLRHEPDKAAAGVADGDITNAGGETDIEIEFPVTIEN